MNKTKYISTTLPYANSVPHIGHAFEFILADSIARYHRREYEIGGNNGVFFNLGIDEHGQKIKDAADKLDIPVQDYLNDICLKWEKFCHLFKIEPDVFYRTSSEDHEEWVQNFWIESLDRGDIYKKKYKGIYCVGCESFKQDKDLVDGKCTDHPHLDIEIVEEENYFFRLSNYKEQILNHVSKDFLKPVAKLKELTNIIDGIEDISISRLKTSVSHGVPVPNDPEQTIYVWFDALLNYIFTVGYGYNKELFEEYWQDTIQICGPDNLKFQGAIWQGILASANIKGTSELLVHGTILDDEGRKMSKSLGNVIDPIEQKDKYGVDAVRYYALAGLSTYGNSNWDEEQLKDLYNTHLANSYGNLVSRVLHLVDTKNVKINRTVSNISIRDAIINAQDNYKKNFEQYQINDAIKEVNKLIDSGNKYINDTKPWGKWWSEKSVESILNDLYELLVAATELYDPIIPGKCQEVRDALIGRKKQIIFPKI